MSHHLQVEQGIWYRDGRFVARQTVDGKSPAEIACRTYEDAEHALSQMYAMLAATADVLGIRFSTPHLVYGHGPELN